ncbi:MAG: arsenate reductase (glutaredoxin) [Acidimicrobiales bacterium]
MAPPLSHAAGVGRVPRHQDRARRPRHPQPRRTVGAIATLYVNPACSKCRTAQGILRDARVDVDEVRYLESPPTRADLLRLMELLGIDDPRQMMRCGEAVYAELGLGEAGVDTAALIDAIAEHPILLERPIFVRGDRAVIGRPPERVLELLG